MKKLICTLALAAAFIAAPTIHAQSTPPPAPACTSPYSGQPGLQASYTSAKTGAVYPSAVWAVQGTNVRASGNTALITVQVFNNLTDEQTCLKPIDTITLSFFDTEGATLFTTYFGSPITVASGQTFAQASVTQSLTAIKNHPKVSAFLSSATNVTL